MTALLATLCAVAAIGGAVLAAAAWRGVLPDAPTRVARADSRPGALTRALGALRRTKRSTWLAGVAGLALGVVLMVVLGWPILVILVPAAVVGLPRLLADPPQSQIALLEALDRWVRGMLAQMSTGKSITDALRLSARQPPPLLADSLAHLAKRLDDRWTTPQALHAMADELDSADADAILAALVLSSERGGTGASVTLFALADSIQDQLRALREIEAERSKPRVVVRQVTTISALALVGFLLFSPTFFAPYATPVGQVILLALLSAYVASIAMMRRLTLPRPRARILRPLP